MIGDDSIDADFERAAERDLQRGEAIGLGLGVGIDYSLFVLSRYREERREGGDEIAAIAGFSAPG